MADLNNNYRYPVASNRGVPRVRGGGRTTSDGKKSEGKERFSRPSNANSGFVTKVGGFRSGAAVTGRAPFRAETMESFRRSVAGMEDNPEQLQALEDNYVSNISLDRRTDGAVFAENSISSDGGFDTNSVGWKSPIISRSPRKIASLGGTSAAEFIPRVAGAAQSAAQYGSANSKGRYAKRSSDEMNADGDDVFLPKLSNKYGGAKSDWNRIGNSFAGKFGDKPKYRGWNKHLKLTGNISDMLDWHSHGDKLQLEFEIYGRVTSPVWVGGDERRKEFCIKDSLNNELRVHYYEIDASIPTMTSSDWMRFGGTRRFTGEFQVTSIDFVKSDELFEVKSKIRNSRRLLESELARLEKAGSKA